VIAEPSMRETNLCALAGAANSTVMALSAGARNRRCSSVYRCLKNAESVQVHPMSGPRFRPVAAFRISFSNEKIGSEDSVFGDQKALLDAPPKRPMTNSRVCSLCCRPSLMRQLLPIRSVCEAIV
jgi:hypothetical protein